MAFPSRDRERELHALIVSGEITAPADVVRAFVEPIAVALSTNLGVPLDPMAYDSAVDAVWAYLDDPGKYDPSKGRLSTFLRTIAKMRAIDRLRRDGAQDARDQVFGGLVELTAPAPKECMERLVEAKEMWPKVKAALPDPRDLRMLELILAGEKTSATFAAALELEPMPEAELRHRVKQHRDRILKVLERLGDEHDDA